MANITALSVGPASCWQPLAEFRATSSSNGVRHLEDQVTEIMQELGLQPLQLERIQMAVLEAVRRASRRWQSSKQVPLVRIQMWVTSKPARSQSWGFFIVEKPVSDLQVEPLETEHLVELFLYQERIS